MSVRNVFKMTALSLVLAAGAASAQAGRDDDEVVEKVAVRNRLYLVEKRFEVGGHVGLSLLPRLTEHYNFNLSVGYNLVEWFAFEARLGYAYAQQTTLAEDVQTKSGQTLPRINEFSNLWQMGFNGVVGVRFQPIYGKINLLAELPVHFQLYLWAGGGVGTFSRESLQLCVQRSGSTCNGFYREGDAAPVIKPLVSLALGFRFFIANRHGVKLEARTWSWPDSYFVNIERAAVTPSNPTANGTLAPNAGFTTLSQLDLGYSFLF
ncbi:MAG: outer membrane beta-barrel domain-containing protein [Myxococcaceae bacterium]|jgi:outer membrane beta-barrel protein|nr:outer membrane beta-barrel domain-containing protein [Myxococcaceae bacterium]MCA3015244.1 outer membrane beta-barrel domain-containing protein [Myxococcaceae bacterium]